MIWHPKHGDDTTQFVIDDFDFTICSKLNWSQNVHEEHNAPNQILIGAPMDPLYCVLLALGVYYEQISLNQLCCAVSVMWLVTMTFLSLWGS
jgi:hypothetical protein